MKAILLFCLLLASTLIAVEQPDFNSKEWQDIFSVNAAGIEDGWNSCGCTKVPWARVFPTWHRADTATIKRLPKIYKIGIEDGKARCKAWKDKK